jgi:hypothetical protein
MLYAFDIWPPMGMIFGNFRSPMRKANLARILAGRPEGIFISDFEQG